METKKFATMKIEVFDKNNYYNKEEVAEILNWSVSVVTISNTLKKIKIKKKWYYEKEYINEFAKEIELRKKIAVPGVFKNPNPVKPKEREGYTTITDHCKKLGCSYFTLLNATKVFNIPKEMYNYNTYHFKIDDLNECYQKYLKQKKLNYENRENDIKNYNYKANPYK
jgi:hypothetical protein